MTTSIGQPSFTGTSIHFFDPASAKLYVYRLEAPADLSIVHIAVSSSESCSDECLLDEVKRQSVAQGYLFAHEEVAMIC